MSLYALRYNVTMSGFIHKYLITLAIIFSLQGCAEDKSDVAMPAGNPPTDEQTGSDAESDNGPPSTSYTLGGSITGLAGTIVLQNNGSDNLALSSDGDFIFGTALAGGADYNITILAQPTGLNQTCTVANGSGSIDGANIVNIIVTCITNTYTIGGMASGLIGAVELQNNGGDDLALFADGEFTFSTALNDGATYEIMVLSQPSDQICTASNNVGTIVGADVADVMISCGPAGPGPMPLPGASIIGADSRITLRWTPVQGASGYNLYYGQSPGISIESGIRIPDVGLSYVHDGLENGVDYYYLITALVSGGEEPAFAELVSRPEPLVPQVSAGKEHTCRLNENGVACWGGDGSTIVIPPLSNPKQVSSGGGHSCALDDNGVTCWGANSHGQTDTPQLENPREVTAGRMHTCALDDSGVKCWGDVAWGKTNVPPLDTPVSVHTNWDHTCAIDAGGVKCWGYGFVGQLNPPVLSNPVKIRTGRHHSCALDDAGVVCWGSNINGESSPPALGNPTDLAIGTGFSCAIDDVEVVCWGSNVSGRLNVPASGNPLQISTGDAHACMVDGAEIKCWGENSYGKASLPAELKNPRQISVGQRRACALHDHGVSCWGTSFGQIVVPSLVNPRMISTSDQLTCALDDAGVVCAGGLTGGMTPAFSNPVYVSAGQQFACAIDDSGVSCWGPGYISLGQPPIPPLDSPRTVRASSLLANEFNRFICALDDAGVTCWGSNSHGQTDVPVLSNPSQIELGNVFACALDGVEVRCWGNTGNIEPVPDLENPVWISTGTSHACAIDETGIVCWGLGKGAMLPPDLYSPAQISSGTGFNCALDQVGVLCWGENLSGQLNVVNLP